MKNMFKAKVTLVLAATALPSGSRTKAASCCEAGDLPPHQRLDSGRQRTSTGHKNGHNGTRELMAGSANCLKNLVGASGFEPEASCAQGRRATRLRYAPT